jgi:flagellar biosynthesis protein FlhF
MKIKSYYSRTVEDAVSQARQELGPEAMLMNSRKAPVEARHLGEYEVVFAVDSLPEISDATGEGDYSAEGAAASERLANEVSDLRKQLEGMRKSLVRAAVPAPQWLGPSPEISDAYTALASNDIAPELARELVHAADRRATAQLTADQRANGKVDRKGFEAALTEEMRSRCNAEPTLGNHGQRPAIVALVGPPGAGKTSTLVKLAVNYGLTSRRPVALLTTDTYRVAAADQLRSYAAILGVGFQVVETPAALAQSLEEHRAKDLVLIDTPGLGFQDLDSGADLARFLSTRTDIDTHLVLSASMKSADLTRVIDAYEVFRPRHLLFTRLDETASYGALFSEAVRTGKPVSFFATGQRIPEDLEVASREGLVAMALGAQAGRAVSAA